MISLHSIKSVKAIKMQFFEKLYNFLSDLFASRYFCQCLDVFKRYLLSANWAETLTTLKECYFNNQILPYSEPQWGVLSVQALLLVSLFNFVIFPHFVSGTRIPGLQHPVHLCVPSLVNKSAWQLYWSRG